MSGNRYRSISSFLSGSSALYAGRFLAIGLAILGLFRGGRYLLDSNELRKVRFHGDESQHLAKSELFDLYFLRHDWHSIAWFHPYWGPDHPHIVHYILGWQLWRNNISRPPCNEYQFGISREHNLAIGSIPPDDALLAARSIMGVLGMGVLVGVVILGWVIDRPLTSAICANLLAGHPLFINTCSRARLDPGMLFGLVVSMALAAAAWRFSLTSSRTKGLMAGGASLLGGFFVGVSMGSKLSGAVSAVFWTASIGSLWLLPAMRKRPLVFRPATSIVLAGVSAAAVFYFSNPYLCSFPVMPEHRLGLFRGLSSMVDHRVAVSARQQQLYPHRAIPRLSDRISRTLSYTLMRRSRSDGRYVALGIFPTGFPIDAALAAAGLAILSVYTMYSYITSGELDGSILLLFWCLISFSATCYSIKIDWSHYHLLFLTSSQFLIAAAISAPLELFTRFRTANSRDVAR
jgi:hypothetical protein